MATSMKKQLLIILFAILSFHFLQKSSNAFENSIGMDFRLIRPGKFMMGSPENELGHEYDEKQHRVIITKAFLMATTETTQKQWISIMGYNPSSKLNRCSNCPVESVSWFEVQKFIKKLNLKEYTNAYRLPTEAEWEYACRAGSKTAFYAGPISSTSCKKDPILDKIGWYCGNSGRTHPYYNLTPKPVGKKRANRFGLYDMHGNVMEWVFDSTSWYSMFSRSTGASLNTYIDNIEDPVSTKGKKKIIRGGSFAHSADKARAANRMFFGPKTKRNYIGFRLVKNIR